MKVPVPCPECRQYNLNMDMTADHQHLSCECGCQWCVVCLGRLDPETIQRQRIAAMN